MFETLPLAETCRYWRTSKSTTVSVWLDRAEKTIADLGGEVLVRAEGRQAGRKAFMIEFIFGEERFRAVWPVLPTKSDTDTARRAAEVQAATMLHHDVKARGMRCAVFGFRHAFLQFLMLPNGSVVGELALPELAEVAPRLLTS